MRGCRSTVSWRSRRKPASRRSSPGSRSSSAYVSGGGALGALRRRIDDLGLRIAGAVGFAEWVVDDESRRASGLERMKRDMDLVAEIGGRFIAAPPFGASKPDQAKPELGRIAERYRAILELGERTGVTPILELWGFSQTLSRLSEVVYVATETAHPQACLLLDSYHLYKGGSDFGGLRLLNGAALPGLSHQRLPGQRRLARRSTIRTASTPATASPRSTN